MDGTQLELPKAACWLAEHFAAHPTLGALHARLLQAEGGRAAVWIPHRTEVSIPDGPIHGGIVATVMDTACGYAALSLRQPGARGVTAEFKVNLLAPASGKALIAIAAVKRAGSRLVVCGADAYTVDAKQQSLVATMLATLSIAE